MNWPYLSENVLTSQLTFFIYNQSLLIERYEQKKNGARI